jgi:uncharacterized iron-regulated protein
MRLRHLGRALVLTLTLIGTARGADPAPFGAIDLDATLTPSTLADRLAAARVVFVGEMHTRYGDHLNQLEIIRQLYERDPSLAIGVEYLQRRFQAEVDDYIAARSSEQEFLRAAEYYESWGYDYRLYAPIFRFAREHAIPVRALNVPSALPPAVAKVGIDGLSQAQRAGLPREIEPAGAAYRERLRAAFGAHGDAGPGSFDHFVEAQLVWDEGMAESAADYLDANPGRRMVVLAGAGHLEFGSGIPERLHRRIEAPYAVVLNGNGGENLEPAIADFVLLGNEQSLPPAGVLGIGLETKGGRAVVGTLSPGGAAAAGGLETGDVLISIDDMPIDKVADVRLALWDKKPGERVHVAVRRKKIFKTVERDVEIALSGPHGVAP